MKTTHSHSLEALKKITGTSPKDLAQATAAAKELESLVVAQSLVVDDYADLRRILTTDSEKDIKDAITSMRHVESALVDLAYFHRDSMLAPVFEPLKNKAGRILRATEQKAAVLISLIEH